MLSSGTCACRSGFVLGTDNKSCRDVQPPSITCPSDITLQPAIGESSQIVKFAFTANDNVALSSSGCSPPSGNAFTAATTRVTCTATDSSNLLSSCSFNVNLQYSYGPYTLLMTCTNTVTSSQLANFVNSFGLRVANTLSVSKSRFTNENAVIQTNVTEISFSFYILDNILNETSATVTAGNIKSLIDTGFSIIYSGNTCAAEVNSFKAPTTNNSSSS